MHAINEVATSRSELDLGFLAEKSNGSKKQRVDDDGNQRNRSRFDTKRAARQQAGFDETEMDLRDARMGYTSFEDGDSNFLD